MHITWYGHATFVLQTDGQIIYIDPFADEPPDQADIVLITHSHFDHNNEDKLIRARKEHTRILTALENAANIMGAEPMEAGETREIGQIKMTAVPAYNVTKFRSPGELFHPPAFGVGWIIEAEGKRLYHAGDTDVIPEMRELKTIDLALLPIGGMYTMTWQEAVEAVKIIKPKQVIPMHYNTPNIGIEADPRDFKDAVEAETSTQVIIIYPGQSLEL